MRVEILSLSLRPEGRVARDSSVVRLFVEYSLLDLPTEETPLSLPKPPRGKSINYNYSKGEAPRRTRLQPLTSSSSSSVLFELFVIVTLQSFLLTPRRTTRGGDC